MATLNLARAFEADGLRLQLERGFRAQGTNDDIAWLLDAFDGAGSLFVRTRGAFSLRLDGHFSVHRCMAGGWLLRSDDAARASYWLPASATMRRIGAQGHILEERPADWSAFDVGPDGIDVTFPDTGAGWSLDGVIWQLTDVALVDELSALTDAEAQGYFLLGSHTRYGRPADLYRHLVHGWVYEDRYAWPHRRRICSENDAHALHLIFSGLRRTTGKRIYDLLKTQLLLSVLSRQGEDGGYRHGEWTDRMESHFRLHCSAMHLMMDALSEADEPAVRTALQKAARFVSDKRDATEVGAWLLHDELELTEQDMTRGPFKWLPGSALGKSPQNMLVLNTHLDALIALDRFGHVTGDARYAPLVESGVKSAKAVLELRPAEWLYRLLFSAIDLTLLPTAEAKRLPVWKRAWKRVGRETFIPRLFRIKNRFPRLVMPGGYIDRHLALGSWAFHYHTVNLMDLARARRRFGGTGFDAAIHAAARFAQNSGVRGRWKELKYERYALGFWAEALWHLRQEFPDHIEYRDWYEEACSDLDALQMGRPPSCLGGNAEALAMG